MQVRFSVTTARGIFDYINQGNTRRLPTLFFFYGDIQVTTAKGFAGQDILITSMPLLLFMAARCGHLVFKGAVTWPLLLHNTIIPTEIKEGLGFPTCSLKHGSEKQRKPTRIDRKTPSSALCWQSITTRKLAKIKNKKLYKTQLQYHKQGEKGRFGAKRQYNDNCHI